MFDFFKIKKSYDFAEDITKFFAEEYNKRIRMDDDLAIGIYGSTGVGKSSLALHILKDVAQVNESTLNDCVVFNYRDFVLYKFNKGDEKYFPLWIDEGEKLLSRRQFMSESNKNIMEFLSICRTLNKLIIVCAPFRPDLDIIARCHYFIILFKQLVRQVDENGELKPEEIRMGLLMKINSDDRDILTFLCQNIHNTFIFKESFMRAILDIYLEKKQKRKREKILTLIKEYQMYIDDTVIKKLIKLYSYVMMIGIYNYKENPLYPIYYNIKLIRTKKTIKTYPESIVKPLAEKVVKELYKQRKIEGDINTLLEEISALPVSEGIKEQIEEYLLLNSIRFKVQEVLVVGNKKFTQDIDLLYFYDWDAKKYRIINL